MMLKVSSLFTDGAVMCRRKEIRIFGEVPEGQEVHAELTAADGRLLGEGFGRGRDGRFIVPLPSLEAHTGCTLTVRAGEEAFTACDIAVGEVFLAGGQSNMELELRNADEGPEIIREHRDPLLRFFNVPRKAYVCEDQQQAFDETRWEAIAPGTGGCNSAVAYFFAAALRKKMPEVPIGIIGCYWGGTSVTCWIEEEELRTLAEGIRYLEEHEARAGDKTMEAYLREEQHFFDVLHAWEESVARFKEENPGAEWPQIEAACGPAPWNPPPGPGSPYRPGGLTDSMLQTVTPVSLTGLLYYQGEDDAWRTERYDELMVLLVRSWRKRFRDPELPFLFVQLPMWIDFNAQDNRCWARTRMAQAAARNALRNSGMVCLLDQGEYGNIHPVVKRPVGERLAELAGAMLYGGGEVSPRALRKETRGNEIIIHLSARVMTPDGSMPALMEIAGEDGVFVPAAARINGMALRLSAEGMDHPLHARYAWCDWSDRVNVFGWNGLPLEPFVF